MSDHGPARRTLDFGEFQCDLCAGELHKNGARVHLADQPFRLLAILLERPGEVVTRQELQERLWPSQSFGDFNDGLNTAVNKLRAALDEKAERPRLIETVPRRGYRFVGKLKELPPSAGGRASPSVWLRGLGGRAGLAVAVALAALLAAGLFLHLTQRPAHARTPQVSLLVLPFRNLTGNPANEYLADGLTQEMITRFSRDYGANLRVIARNSAMSYKGSRRSLARIAAALRVQYVVQGSVRAEGNHLRVAAQLIRASDQSSLWADSYDGDASQLLEFEGSVAQSVAHELSLKVLAGRGRAYVPRTLAAHDDYLRGLYFLSQRSRRSLEQALESFAAATVGDPHYARAYAELADTYNLMGEYTWINPQQARSLGKAAAEQAIAADPSLAEAYAALGFSDWFYGWNPPAAERELRHALQLNPNNADAHHWLAQVLMTRGRFAESERQMREALAFDPNSLIIRTNFGWLHYFERRYPLAIAEMKGVLRQDPNFLTAHYKLWEAYSVTGDRADAWKECRQLVEGVSSPQNARAIEAAYRRGGYARALEKFGTLQDASFYGSDVDAARCLIFAGDKARALDLLRQAYRARDGWMIFVPVDPAFDPLRSNPHFARLTLRLRLPAPPST